MLMNYIIGLEQVFSPGFMTAGAWYDRFKMTASFLNLHTSQARGGSVIPLGPAAWRLELPAGSKAAYRLAQLDDYHALSRKHFPRTAPLIFSLSARVSGPRIPGTWGFGLWNDPFSANLGFKGMQQRLPALPQAAWFFYASPQNYLSFRDDLPAQGFLAATFGSVPVGAVKLGILAAQLPLAFLPSTSQIIRRQLRRVIHQGAAPIDIDVTQWHDYELNWSTRGVNFTVDAQRILQTPIAPQAPLGLVIWVDNQYAALPPQGRLRFGTLPNPEPVWLEIRDALLTRE